jgi:hypothetical protein
MKDNFFLAGLAGQQHGEKNTTSSCAGLEILCNKILFLSLCCILLLFKLWIKKHGTGSA